MTSLKENLDVLRRVPIFDSVDPTSLRLLAFGSRLIVFEPGQDLVVQGGESDEGYVLISGSADVLIEAGPNLVKIAEVGRNDFVGDIAILTDKPRSATVRATSRIEALVITKAHLLDLLRHSPQMGIAMMRVLAERLVATSNELARARAGTA
jgi:CRP-like cAMP-binding protein